MLQAQKVVMATNDAVDVVENAPAALEGRLQTSALVCVCVRTFFVTFFSLFVDFVAVVVVV